MPANRFGRRSLMLGIPGTLAAQQAAAPPKAEKEEEVSPAEDLMREHGVLKRALLVYRECVNRIEGGKEFPPEVVTGAADLIRRFIEEYHERLEEEFLFPRFRKANTLLDLVDVLNAQHKAGRHVTQQILQSSRSSGLARSEAAKRELANQMRAFIRMYEPHEAREDTVLFPAFRQIVTPAEYAALGEQFEEREHKLFGEDGFEKIVAEVAVLEKKVGIYDLSQFTPKV